MRQSHLKCVGVLFFVLWQGTTVAAGEWWNSAWKYRQRVTVDASSIEEDLEDFPLRLHLKDAQFARTLARGDGLDLRVIGADGSPLPHEVVSWGLDNVKVYALIPAIKARDADQSIHLYFGNPQPGERSVTPVWDRDYRMILHVAGDLDDAAGRALPVSREGFVVQNGWTAGLIMAESLPWVWFDSKQRGFLNVSDAILGELGPDVTFSCRFRARQKDRRTLVSGHGDTDAEWFDCAIEPPRAVLRGAGTSTKEVAVDGVEVGRWQSLVVSYQSTAGARTICLDGKALARDKVSAVPMKLTRLQIGRGTRDTETSQFHGDVEEVRLLNGVYSDARMKAEALNLNESSPLVDIGPLEGFEQPFPPPAPPELILPLDGVESHKKTGVRLEWQPSVGAERYTVDVYSDREGKHLLKTVDAGADTSTTLESLKSDRVPRRTVFWTVVARSEHGETRAEPLRSLTFYRWAQARRKSPKLAASSDVQVRLEGYLGDRIDRIARSLVAFADNNPGMLRMLRERPQKVIPWSGIYCGQYLSSASLIWRLTGDDTLKKKIDSFARDLIASQREDGYLGPFDNLRQYVSLWNHYALLYGLLSYYEDTGYKPALAAAKKAADLVIETYGPEGHTVVKAGGANESISHAIALLYKMSGEARYLDMTNYFIHEVWNEKGGVRYFKNGLERRTVDDFPVRRWESVYNISTLAEMYWLTGDDDYRSAFEHLWWTLQRSERHATGGFSTNEGLLGTPYNPGTIETCCTLAWIMLSIDMLRLTGDSRIADEIEWSTLNSALGSIPFDGSCSTYAVQADGHRQYCVLQQGPPEGDGPELNCCSTNANRAIGSIAEWAVMKSRDGDGVTVNFYGPSTLSAHLPSGNAVTIRQVTEYPADANVQLQVSLPAPEPFTLNLRIPQWSSRKKTAVKLNGDPIINPVPGTYLSLERRWQDGDRVDLKFDFTPRFWAGEDERSGRIAVYRGPILYAHDADLNTGAADTLPPIAWRGVTIQPLAKDDEARQWIHAKFTDGKGTSFTACDFASAGMTGKYYRSWFPANDLPPSPFHLEEPHEPTNARIFRWEPRAGADSWTLSIATRRDLRDAHHIKGLKEPRAEISELGSGQYYWTVVAHNENGETAAANAPFRRNVE